MTVLGSVFLGDAHHHRVFSTTPPSSPSAVPTSPSRTFRAQQARQVPMESSPQPDPEIKPLPPPPPPPPPAPISPEVSLELRLRWLEALLLGVRQDAAGEARRKTGGGDGAVAGKDAQTQTQTRTRTQTREPLYRRAEDVRRRLEAAIAANDGLKRFMEQYDQHAQFLAPSFALSGVPGSAPTYAAMSPTELDAFLSEMENDIRAADRDLREIDTLEKRGVTGAGRLVEHEVLGPRLEALVTAHEEDLVKAASLEARIAALLERHATRVDALSELFVAWNDVITEAEDRVDKAERGKEAQRRLGYE